MRVGRNDPCPCGSGKKYKLCCLELDRVGVRPAGMPDLSPGDLREAMRRATEWEADVLAMLARFDDEPDARPGALIVTAAGFVVACEVLSRPSPEPEDLARALARGLAVAAERVGSWPETVLVREQVVADALARRLEAERPELDPAPVVMDRPDLPGVDVAGQALIVDLVGGSRAYFASSPETWAGWDLPGELVAELFRAAAAFHRAAPWRELSDAEPLDAVVPGGGEWTVVVLGQGREKYGLHLYSDAADYWAIHDGETIEQVDFRGWLIAISFDPGEAIPRAMRKEIARAGWEVAGPEAYPQLLTIDTPAGGVRRRQAEDLLALVRAVPAFVAAHPGIGGSFAGVSEWTDPATGVSLSLRPELDRRGGDRPLPTGGPEGPGADPEAAFPDLGALDVDSYDEDRLRALAVLDDFARHLAQARGLSEATVRKHVDNAEHFLEFLHGMGVPRCAVHAYDLRWFLYDWYPRKVYDSESRARSLPVSLGHFFAFLEAEEGIVCPWAKEILDDREAYRYCLEQAPDGFFWDESVIQWRALINAELAGDLLLAGDRLGEDDVWGPTMGLTEAALQRELQRRWLIWRDELIRAGADRWHDLAPRLVERQRQWELAPHPGYGGRTPVEVVRQERAERAERLSQDERS